MGEWLRTTGGEYGVTTGRDRRCGWFDAVIARYATRINGVTDYFLTSWTCCPAWSASRCAWRTRWTACGTTRSR
ncbi:hypothetical protein GCM10020220_109140 [Nonomuraea rubra]